MSFSGNIEATIRLLRAVLVLGLLAVVVWLTGPGIEGKISPILKYARRGEITRVDDRACWVTYMEKARDSFPIRARYTVSYDLLVPAIPPWRPTAKMTRIKTSTRVDTANGGVPLDTPGFAYHPPNIQWRTEYCTVLPRSVRGKEVTIEGVLDFEVWHPFWLVPAPLPTITFPAE